MTGAVRVYAKGYVLDLTVPPKPISSRSESDRDPSLRCDSDSDGPPFCGVGCSAGGPTPGGPPAVSTARKSARLRASERACVHACVLARVRVALSFLPSLFRSPSPSPSHSHSPAPCAPPSLSLRERETPHNPPPPSLPPFHLCLSTRTAPAPCPRSRNPTESVCRGSPGRRDPKRRPRRDLLFDPESCEALVAAAGARSDSTVRTKGLAHLPRPPSRGGRPSKGAMKGLVQRRRPSRSPRVPSRVLRPACYLIVDSQAPSGLRSAIAPGQARLSRFPLDSPQDIWGKGGRGREKLRLNLLSRHKVRWQVRIPDMRRKLRCPARVAASIPCRSGAVVFLHSVPVPYTSRTTSADNVCSCLPLLQASAVWLVLGLACAVLCMQA